MAKQVQREDSAWTPEQQMQELKKRMGMMMTIMQSTEKPSFKPRPNDIIVVVPPKHGTTWLLHICHQIRMKGQEPDFEDQFDVVGWIEASDKLLGKDTLSQPQPADPRVFVSHLTYHLVPKGGKKIFSFREPKDAVVSAYHFMDSALAMKGRVPLPIFAQVFLQRIEQQLNDLLDWWEHRGDDNVMLLFYDDLKEDHAGSVRRIARYMGVDCDEDAIARVVHTTSHAEMSRHASKFDTRKFATKMTEKFGEAPVAEGEYVGRVRKDGGKSGEGKRVLPAEVQQQIEQLWQRVVTSKLGFKNLQEMREAWKKECSDK